MRNLVNAEITALWPHMLYLLTLGTVLSSFAVWKLKKRGVH